MQVRVGIPSVQTSSNGKTSRNGNPKTSSIDLHDHAQASETVQAVMDALRTVGMEPVRVSLNQLAIAATTRVDVVFPILPKGGPRSLQPALIGLLETAGIPFVGSGLAAQVLALHKDLAKKVLIHDGIPTPSFQVFRRPEEALHKDLQFPLFVKPAHEGSSLGLWRDSLVFDGQGLRTAVERVLRVHRQPAIVEEFLDGPEYTVGVLATPDPQVLPVCEIDFGPMAKSLGGHAPFYSREAKSHDAARVVCPADVSEAVSKQLAAVARATFSTLGCAHLARVDMRLDRSGVAQVLELNALPGMHPELSDFPRMVQAAGYSYTDLIGNLVNHALNPAEMPQIPTPPNVTARTS